MSLKSLAVKSALENLTADDSSDFSRPC